MNKVLMSIKPEWASKIYDNRKQVELRKSTPRVPFKVFFIESGTRTITGEGVVREVLIYTFPKGGFVDQALLTSARISAEQFKAYAKDEPVYAMHLSDVVRYDTPQLYEGTIPQSWMYCK